MSNNVRVANISRHTLVSFKHARKAVIECACAWVEYGKTIRDLTLLENIAARAAQEKSREPLEYAELPNIIVKPVTRNKAAFIASKRLAREAMQFADAHNGL